MHDLVPLILGMAAVTYIPRLLPFIFLTDRTIPTRFDAFLKCIPAAALGALIIPGVFSVTPDFPAAALIGIGFAVVYGIFRGGMIVPVLGSVVVTYLVLLKFG